MIKQMENHENNDFIWYVIAINDIYQALATPLIQPNAFKVLCKFILEQQFIIFQVVFNNLVITLWQDTYKWIWNNFVITFY